MTAAKPSIYKHFQPRSHFKIAVMEKAAEKGVIYMAEYIKKIDPFQVRILKCITFYDTDTVDTRYYVGFLDELETSCILSKLFYTKRQAVDALKNGEYKTEVTVKEYENGLKLYYPVNTKK